MTGLDLKNGSKYKNIQGCINATVVRLFKQDKDKLEQYKKTLTNKQINYAKGHLNTIIQIKDNKKKYY